MTVCCQVCHRILPFIIRRRRPMADGKLRSARARAQGIAGSNRPMSLVPRPLVCIDISDLFSGKSASTAKARLFLSRISKTAACRVTAGLLARGGAVGAAAWLGSKWKIAISIGHRVGLTAARVTSFPLRRIPFRNTAHGAIPAGSGCHRCAAERLDSPSLFIAPPTKHREFHE